MIQQIFNNYKSIPKNVLFTLYAYFFLQLVHTSFILIVNLFLVKEGYTDKIIADIISYKFLGVLCCSLPLGIYIKEKPLKPVLYYAAIGFPLVSILIVFGAQTHNLWLLCTFSFLSGVFFSCSQIIILPFIVRNTDENYQAEAISLQHAAFSCSMIFSCVLISLSGCIKNITEKEMLLLFSCLGFVSLYFIYMCKDEEHIPKETVDTNNNQKWMEYNWNLIIPSLIPHFIIAIGAGLTMPFMNLFFYYVHNLDYDSFSLLNLSAFGLVSIAFFYIPSLKKKYGWYIIVFSQSSAIALLFLLAITDFYPYTYSLYLAVVCFMFRQPLMNMAIPVTSQLMMKYVGTKNQEMTSALSSALWSGSWFISTKIFKYLRASGLGYGHIFIITSVLYLLGTFSYHKLIQSFIKRTTFFPEK